MNWVVGRGGGICLVTAARAQRSNKARVAVLAAAPVVALGPRHIARVAANQNLRLRWQAAALSPRLALVIAATADSDMLILRPLPPRGKGRR